MNFLKLGMIALLVALVPGLALAINPEETFTHANAAFISGKYDEAVKDYELIRKDGYASPELFFNLANAYYRQGKIGNAVLHYERALWLKPNDADAKANLKFVRKNLGLFEPSIPWWKWFSQFLSLNQWAWLSSGIWILFCVMIICGWFFPNARKNFRTTNGLLLFALLFALSGLMLRSFENERAVLLESKTALRIAPLENSPASYSLPAGTIVAAGKEKETPDKKKKFVYVESEEGRTGWVLSTEVEKIVP